jgi:hypothetical protein
VASLGETVYRRTRCSTSLAGHPRAERPNWIEAKQHVIGRTPSLRGGYVTQATNDNDHSEPASGARKNSWRRKRVAESRISRPQTADLPGRLAGSGAIRGKNSGGPANCGQQTDVQIAPRGKNGLGGAGVPSAITALDPVDPERYRAAVAVLVRWPRWTESPHNTRPLNGPPNSARTCSWSRATSSPDTHPGAAEDTQSPNPNPTRTARRAAP